MMKVLLIGGGGMLGSQIASFLYGSAEYDIAQTLRIVNGKEKVRSYSCDVNNTDDVLKVLITERPEWVINCVGVIKQRAESSDPLVAYPINALFPHRLADMCEAIGSRVVHFSTDCVFSGKKGMYTDDAGCDVTDHYGVSKKIGELEGRTNALTLRTLIVGHEVSNHFSLIDWFLAQKGEIKGYRKAIYSGLPTVEVARILSERILPRDDIHGVYNLSSEPISKYELLKIVRDVYGKKIEIIPDDSVQIDRSLDSTALRSLLNYTPPPWTELVQRMFETRF